ncbi:MAG TPA: protein kinase [Solirubrobacteraceae bacterium]|jgi:serine/threonine-protein kinase|nr:protein kinase [Solirubrobacteraceae bacterium]
MTERRTTKTARADGGHRTLAGRYELGEVIGRGGMGTVYRAVDRILGREVAVKTLPWLLADQDPTNIARFEREARAAAKLSHPAVVSVYDTGADDRTHFIVMELVAGRSLEAILREQGPLDPEHAVRIATRVAEALAAAHAAGVVHRDIKPANVMVADDGSVKVLDFGIARAAGTSTLTQGSSVIGTAAYMSPEQAVGEAADERSDIYSLGCVLYALLTGHPPFTGEGSAAVLSQQANSTPRPLRDENPRIPPGVSALAMEMLAKAPEARPQSAREVSDRLRALSADGGAAMAATEPTVALGRTAGTRRLPGAGAMGAGGAAAGAAAAGAAGASGPAAARASGPAAAGAGTAPTRASERRRALVVGGIVAAILLIALVVLASGGGSPRRATSTKQRTTPATAATSHPRSTAAKATPTAARTTPAATAPARTTPAAPPPTVAGAAGALTTLLTQDVQAGTVTQQAAQQIATGLTGILHAWDAGNRTDAQNHLAALSQQVTQLEQQGGVSASAAPALNHALANLGAALASGTPPAAQSPAPPAPTGGHLTPGHGGAPPGKAKKHGGGGGD